MWCKFLTCSITLQVNSGDINSILIAEVVVVRSDQHRITLSAVPTLLSSWQCQQGTSKAKREQGLFHTSTLVACHSQRTQSLKSVLCGLPVACEQENKGLT